MTGGSFTELANTMVDELATQKTVVDDADVDIIDAIRGAVALRAVVDDTLARLTSQADRVGVATRCGMSLRELLCANGVAPAVAARLIRLGRAIPVLPHVARHSRDGALSAEHLDAVARGVDHVSRRTGQPIESDLIVQLEHTLVGRAVAGHSPAEIIDAARAIAIENTPDFSPGAVAPAEDPTLNDLAWTRAGDGRLRGEFDFDVLTGERLVTALDAASRPRPEPDGTPDPRTVGRRRADAFGQLLESATRTLSPDALSAPAATELILTMRLDEGVARDDTGATARLTWLGPVSDLSAALLSCDARLTGIGTDPDDAPVSTSTRPRLFTGRTRTAILTRDQCCIKCGAPASWTDVHHVIHHSDGGPTIVDNGCLLCRTCHVAVHTAGWDVYIGHDRHPWLVPPAAVDPRRTPLPAYNRRTLRLTEPVAA